jgi:hypothetical protein
MDRRKDDRITTKDNILSLWMEDFSYAVKFKVLKISQHELEMESGMGDFILKFSRIKEFD